MSKFLIGNIKGPKGDKGEQGATGPKGEQGIQGPVGPAGGVNSVNGMTGDVTVEDTQGVNLLTGTRDFNGNWNQLIGWTIDGKYNQFTVLKRNIAWYGVHQNFYVKTGETYTFSVFAKADKNVDAHLYLSYLNGGEEGQLQPYDNKIVISTDWERFSAVGTAIRDGLISPRIESEAEGTYVYICGYKLERGIVTDPVWTPAPEDILLKGEVDGRNLILDSAKEISNSDYKIAQYSLSEDFEKGRYYTITVWGELGAGLTSFRMFIGGGNVSVSDAKKISDGIYSVYAIRNSIPEDTNTKSLYVFIDKEDLGVASTIHKIKLEPGINPNPHWTPAPEDVVVRSELEPILIPDYKITTKNEETFRYIFAYKYGKIIWLRAAVNLSGAVYPSERRTYTIDSRYKTAFMVSSASIASTDIGSYVNRSVGISVNNTELTVDNFNSDVKEIYLACIYVMQ